MTNDECNYTYQNSKMECLLCLEYYADLDLVKGQTTACCYHWICQSCVESLSPEQSQLVKCTCTKVLALSQGCGCTLEDISQLQAELDCDYQAMQDFYHDAKGLLWCVEDDLGLNQDRQQLWSQYYHAEVKAFQLAQTELTALAELARVDLLTTVELPRYQFQRPGVIVVNRDGQKAIVKDYYGLGSGAQVEFRALLAKIIAGAMQLFPEHDLDYHTKAILKQLSGHPRTTWSIVSCNLDLPWDWEILRLNRNLDWCHISAHSTEKLGRFDMLSHHSTTLDMLEKILDDMWLERLFGDIEECDLGFYLAANPNLTVDFIAKHDDIDWSYSSIGRNPAITSADIDKLMIAGDRVARSNLLFGYNTNPAAHQDLLIKYPGGKWWGYPYLTKSPNISWGYISQYLDQKWDWEWLASSAKIDMDTFLQHPDKFSHFGELAANPNVTWDMIKNNDLDWGHLWSMGRNINITKQMILEQGQEIIDFAKDQAYGYFLDMFTLNPNIDLAWIRDHPEIPWAWDIIFFNVMSQQLTRLGWSVIESSSD